jgi:hypothetical protein
MTVQVGAGAIEELLEDREKRYAELAAVHESLRMLEDGRLTMIDRNLIAKKVRSVVVTVRVDLYSYLFHPT